MIGPRTDNSIDGGSHNQQAGTITNHGISPADHAQMMRDQRDALQIGHDKALALLERATDAEKAALRGQITGLDQRIAEYERRLANPETAYAEYLDKITQLERLLQDATDATKSIGANRTADAKVALETRDYAKADAIFAEVEELENSAVHRAADAAFGRGLIAEEQVRWHDAASHYARAAQLNPAFDTSLKAREFAYRAADFAAALRWGADLIALATSGGDQWQQATALNEHATTLNALGRNTEAEVLIRQALDIGRATIGEAHPDYATNLDNLARAVRDQGRPAEAEALFRQALDIDRATIGEAHPTYANHLNNLARAVQDQGRPAEAEPLFRQALDIARTTIGEAHPTYALGLTNLAGVVQDQGRLAEAEPLFRQALDIARATIGAAHPTYAINLNNLARAVQDQGRHVEAEGLFRQALDILLRSLGDQHPNTRTIAKNLISHLESHAPDTPDLPALRALRDGTPQTAPPPNP